MTSLIKCKNCGTEIEVSEALTHQIEEQIVESLKEEHKKEMEALKIEAREKAKKDVEEKFNLEFVDLKKQIAEKEKKVNEFREKEMSLREEKRKLEEKEKDLELRVQRTLDAERKKIEEKISVEIEEKKRFEVAEKDKIIDSLKRSLDEAQRKANLTSQQLQGEVMELDLERTLIENFPDDEIVSIEKGVVGADVKQIVKTKRGNICGIILWESKRTKAWSDSWIGKLKEDLGASKANIPVIVTDVFPKDLKGPMTVKNNVWICKYEQLVFLAQILRDKLIAVARERFISQGTETKSMNLYQYITSSEFGQRVDSMFEGYEEMRKQIDRERRAFEKLWREREAQIDRVTRSTSSAVGAIKGTVGNSMPQIKALDLLEIEPGVEEE